jgi:hypothetical protein
MFFFFSVATAARWHLFSGEGLGEGEAGFPSESRTSECGDGVCVTHTVECTTLLKSLFVARGGVRVFLSLCKYQARVFNTTVTTVNPIQRKPPSIFFGQCLDVSLIKT